jgi:two-component system KDP operon response regulator KdpE
MSNPAPVVIVVEDDVQIRRFVLTALASDGCIAYEADSVKRGLIEAGTRKPDLVVLDLGLPDGSGVDLIRDLRGWSDIPVIVLSARLGEADKIEALDAGADDYLTKPFGAGELLARVRAQLRRRACGANAGDATVEFGGVHVDLANRLVTRNGEPLHLTPIEYRLLAYLLANAGKVLTHRQLLRDIWGPSHAEDSHYVRVYMGHLRRKIENDASQPRHIVTESGVGYRFVA